MDGLLTFRDYCFPFRVLWKQTTGISIIATRDIQPLELVLYEWNLVVGPRKLRQNCKSFEVEYVEIIKQIVCKYTKVDYVNRVGENLVCVECLKVLDSSNEFDKTGGQSCGMCELPICSDQCQVRLFETE